MDYQDLMAQERYEDAISLLTTELESAPNDDKRRALAECLARTGKVQDAIRVLTEVHEHNSRDHALLLFCHRLLKDSGNMESSLKTTLESNPNPSIYYQMAIAEAQGRYNYEFDEASKEMIMQYLTKATNFDGCNVDTYIWLESLQDYQDTDAKIRILRKALVQHPTSMKVRSRLASILIHRLQDHLHALEVLSPLLNEDKVCSEVKWYVFKALVGLGKFVEARKTLESIGTIDEAMRSHIEADLLIREGRLGEWLTMCQTLPTRADPDATILGHFRRAYVNLRKGNVREGIRCFVAATDGILKRHTLLESELYLTIDDNTFTYSRFDFERDVCEHISLLYGSDELVTDNILGRALYTIYLCRSPEYHNEILDLLQKRTDSLLILAAEMLGYPSSLGNELAWYFVDKDPLRAICYYLTYCIWAIENGIERLPRIKEYSYDSNEQFDVFVKERGIDIHQVAMEYLQNYCDDSQTVKLVFMPFYQDVWRDILFERGMFDVVAEVVKRFVEVTDGTEGLFDLAYALNELGNINESESLYRQLLQTFPDNDAALNNLAVIQESRGLLDEAYGMFQKAVRLSPEKKLYIRNRDRVQNRLSVWSKALEKVKEAYDVISHKALELGLSKENHTELNSLYWNSDLTVKQIQNQFGVRNIYSLIIPKAANSLCPNCSVDRVYKSRTALNAGRIVCIGCGHRDHGWCNCEYCKRKRKEEQQRIEEARLQAALKEFQKLQEKYCRTEYVEWAVSKLTRRERIFLGAFIEVVENEDNPTWEEVCDRAGVVSHRIYVDKLRKIKLLLDKPGNGVTINSAVRTEMLQVKTVRSITKTLRFNILQRDKHTCQYCGRTPPEVTLVIDHLLPVAHDGTDDPDNLVTSCEDCNAGKSDKLIKDFTGGYTKDEWRDQIHAKRLEVIKERRAHIGQVTQHWKDHFGLRGLTKYDEDAIYRFIERYNPEWIKAAVSITASKKIEEYVKYIGGILRNWAKDGPPVYLSDADAGLEDRPATERQKEYIHSLLDGLGLELAEIYIKTDYNQLNMLDAQNLIEALTENVYEQNNGGDQS